MTEIWVETGNTSRKNNTKVAISNKGRILTKDGKVHESKYREGIRLKGKLYKVHQFIAQNFIPKTEEDIRLNRNCRDHITHNPVGININDVRNMRWCTQKENNGFEESRRHRSESMKGNKLKHKSDFGIKFLNHYGLHYSDDKKLYYRELVYYNRHNNKCRWEK